MEKVPCTGNILVHFKNLPHAWIQQVWGQAADIVKHKHPALHCVVRAEVLQLRLHLPSAPFGIPVLYWDQHWDLWFVLHSSGFQHLLTTGLVFGSGHGNPREAKILAHKRGKHLCSAFTYQQNAQPRLDRATHSQWGYRNLVKPFHLCRKRAWPTWKVFYQTASIHQRQLFTETKCLGLWVTISLMRRIYPSALSPYLPLSSIPKFSFTSWHVIRTWQCSKACCKPFLQLSSARLAFSQCKLTFRSLFCSSLNSVLSAFWNSLLLRLAESNTAL